MPRGYKITPAAREEIRRLRYREQLPQAEIAERLGLGETTIRRYAPGRVAQVEVEPLREAFLRSGVSASSLARKMGWTSGSNGHADASRVLRTLGLREDTSGNGRRGVRRTARTETVVALAEAMGLDPFEVGA